MGIYLNPGKQKFTEAVNSEIYVDKTEMIRYLNTVVATEQKYVSVSRPRRFGKTMAANMICAYYDRESDSRTLFEGRKLSKCDGWDVNLGKHDVLRLNMIDFLTGSADCEEMLDYLTEEVTAVFIPNCEILEVFKESTDTAEWTPIMQAFQTSQELLKATWGCDETKVAKLMEKAHDRADNKTYNSEAALSYAIQYAFYAAQKYYTTIRELDTGKGYADIVYLPSPKYPDKPALLIELKYDKTGLRRRHWIRSGIGSTRRGWSIIRAICC